MQFSPDVPEVIAAGMVVSPDATAVARSDSAVADVPADDVADADSCINDVTRLSTLTEKLAYKETE